MRALVNYQIADEFSKKTGIDTVAVNPYKRLAPPVASHPDMLFCVLDKTVFCYHDYMVENDLCDIIKNAGYDLVFVSNKCAPEYPFDISLNVLIMGKTLFCNIRHTATEIIDYAKVNGYTVFNVKQGYSACSTLVVDENTAITSDFGMMNAINSCEKKALYIDNTGIVLPGYDRGFIGGACAKIGGRVCFFGDISAFSEGEKISKLLAEKEISSVSIVSGNLYDFGGIKMI